MLSAGQIYPGCDHVSVCWIDKLAAHG